jgi:starvation-inducible DNA-binding protein
MKLDIGIPKKDLSESVAMLTTLLADEVTLYLKTRKFHWNVAGQSFMELHKLFEAQYTELDETMDEVAERIGKLGSKTVATMREYMDIARIKESPDKYPNQKDMLEELLNDHAAVATHIRNDIETADKSGKDVGTIDLLTSIIQQHETNVWILRRYLD